MKTIKVTVSEEVEHVGYVSVPDDFDVDNDEHHEALTELFLDQHEAFQEDVLDREYSVEDAPKTHANATLEVE